MADVKKYTSIQISKETAERLRNIGRMGDSYESLVNRLLSENEEYLKSKKKPPKPPPPEPKSGVKGL